ncbi:MAG TPA: hypothetical protein VHE77_17710 [Dongiaceae bacterium]|nr:hypothetical protein [Dongiaceae bacterium]
MRHLAQITAGLALGLLPLLGAPAQAEPQKQACLNATSWVSDVKDHSKGMSVFVLSDIQGLEAEAIVARINAMPPASDLRADHVIVLGARADANQEPAPYVLVAFFSHDCLVTSGRADPRDTAEMLSGEDI